MATDPRVVVLRWFEEVWNLRRLPTIDELLDDESVCYSELGPIRGRAGFRERMFQPFLAAFPDLRVIVEDLIAEEDKVAVRWTAQGTHSGSGLGLKKTDNPVRIHGMTWIRVEEGRIREGWQASNMSEVFQSLRQ